MVKAKNRSLTFWLPLTVRKNGNYNQNGMLSHPAYLTKKEWT